MTHATFTPVLFGQRLRDAREARGMTQLQLATSLGVTAARVSHLECATFQTLPSVRTVRRLADALGVDWLTLIDGGVIPRANQ